MPRLLIVEDNEMNRDMLSRRLAKRGYDVAIAVDGEQGLAMARSAPPALILMDMSLPGLDGWEATRQLKGMEKVKATPIIALSAFALKEEIQKSLAAGCSSHLTKPIRKAVLMEAIAAHTGSLKT